MGSLVTCPLSAWHCSVAAVAPAHHNLGRVFASPLAKTLASQKGFDIRSVAGTGTAFFLVAHSAYATLLVITTCGRRPPPPCLALPDSPPPPPRVFACV
jgi:hypothetical protein